MPVYCSVIFSFCRRPVARAYHPRALRRKNISKYCATWQPRSAAKPAALVATVRLAAEFRNWHLIDCHGQRSRGRRLQLPHRERLRRLVIHGIVILGLVIHVARGHWPPPCAIFFKIGEHKIVFRQQSVTFTKFYRRRILGRELAPGRSITVALRRGQMVRHGMLANYLGNASLLGWSAMGQAACG
jgi:hypothetical protein